MKELQTILIDLLCLVLAVAVGYLADRLRERMGADRLRRIVEDAVEAAEGMLRKDDPSGEKRLGFVTGLLERAGYPVTDEVRALIEAAVYRLGQARKRAQ